MQPASSRIWTRVAVSLSNDNNDYTTGTSLDCYRKVTHRIEILVLKYFKNQEVFQTLVVSGLLDGYKARTLTSCSEEKAWWKLYENAA